MSALDLPPYAQWLGVTAEVTEDGPCFRAAFDPRLEGRPGFFHGGALAGLLEIAAVGTLRHALGEAHDVPAAKPVSVTFDFMRGARPLDTFATARIVRLGSRIANVEAHAWQDDRARPVAAARMTLLLVRAAPQPSSAA